MTNKKILLIIVILFMTACQTNYSLKYDGSNLEETISASGISEEDMLEGSFPLSSLEDKQVKLFPDSKTNFEQNYIVDENMYTITYKAKHNLDSFSKESYLNNCFDKVKTIKGDNTFYISAYRDNSNGRCFQKNSLAKFITDYEVLSSNADRKEGNSYIWDVDKHANGIEIMINTSKLTNEKSTPFLGVGLFKIIFAIVIVVLLVPTYIILKKKVED